MKKPYLVIFILFFTLTAHAQQKKIDSLKKLIAATKEDTTKVSLLWKLEKLYFTSKPDTALLLAQQMMSISKKVQYLKGQAIAFNLEANFYNNTGNYPAALSFYLSALKINEQLGDQGRIGSSFALIAQAYDNEGDYRQFINFTLKARAIDETFHNESYVSADLLNLGDGYEQLNILDSALLYTTQAYKLIIKFRDVMDYGIILNNFGNIYSKLHQLDTALHYYRRSIPYIKQAQDYVSECETKLGMAKIFKQLGQPDSSLYYARQSVAAGLHNGYSVGLLAASQFLTAYFKQQGKLDSAFRYLDIYTTAKDSLYSQQKIRAFQNLSFVEQQRQQDIQEQEAAYQARIRYYLMGATIVLLLILAFVFWRNNHKNKKAKRVLQLQKEQIQTTLSELKTTQSQLVQREKMASLGELTAGIAHEIQNPLNFVNNFSEVSAEMIDELDEELDKGDVVEAKVIAADIRQNLEKINHHGKRADFIVKGMLEHSRTNTGEKQLTDINILADEFLKLSYHGLRAKDKSFNAELVTQFAESLPKVNIVQQDIGRVLLNLFNNAFYAVNQKQKTTGDNYKPTVTVTTFTPPSGGWGVKVHDNGNGIPDAIKNKIMQPFFTTKPTGEGTGLGLSLSYDIVVKGHGGSITVDTKENEYSEFTIILPIS